LLGDYDHRIYDLAAIQEQEIARKAELARLLKDSRERRPAGVLRNMVWTLWDALAPKNVQMPRWGGTDGDVPD